MTFAFYGGYAIALLLSRGLGRLFWIPMLLNLGFNLALNLSLLDAWDIRLLMVGYGFAVFLWVLTLSQALTKSTFVVVLVADLAVIAAQLYPAVRFAGAGPIFWNDIGTHIVDIWLTSIFVLVVSMTFRCTVIAAIHGRRIDLLTNPKNRFQLPIGLWAGVIALPPLLAPGLPQPAFNQRFIVAALLLVWGWVILELPPYLVNRRLMRCA